MMRLRNRFLYRQPVAVIFEKGVKFLHYDEVVKSVVKPLWQDCEMDLLSASRRNFRGGS